jgi:hypothetical protein
MRVNIRNRTDELDNLIEQIGRRRVPMTIGDYEMEPDQRRLTAAALRVLKNKKSKNGKIDIGQVVEGSTNGKGRRWGLQSK